MPEACKTRTVCIFQRVLCEYRKAFFLCLRRELQQQNVRLIAAAGTPWPDEPLFDVLDDVPDSVRLRTIKLPGKAYWMQGACRLAWKSDLAVMEQASSVLHNYPLLLRRLLIARRADRTKLAFWGHGASFDADPSQVLRRRFKSFWTPRVDWWFPYAEMSASCVERCGFPRERMTIIQNSIDTAKLKEERAAIDEAELAALRDALFPGDRKLGVSQTVKTGVFCGRMIALRKIPFLLEALEQVARSLPFFRMIMIGDGPEMPAVRAFCENHTWCVAVGSQYGSDRTRYMALGDIFVAPGAIGLALLDAFALGLPVATTRDAPHGPEISYLTDGTTGIISDSNPAVFASRVVQTLRDGDTLSAMRKAALQESTKYSAENMAQRFAEGVEQCLSR